MNILKLYQDFGVPIAPMDHKHAGDGWVNTVCCWCSGNPGYHLGFCTDPTSKYFNRFVCWRCGGKKTYETLAVLLKVTGEQARAIAAQYGGGSWQVKKKEAPRPIAPIRSAQLPPGVKRIQDVPGAIRYLKQRRFDPDQLEAEWGVMATHTGAVLKLKSGKAIDYSYRVIIPIQHKGKTVSYQGRDWTGKSGRKYLAAPPEAEGYPIKSCLYGLDKAEGMSRVRLVEGVTDSWRMGVGFLACFGIKYRTEQVRELLKFEEVGLLFDPDPQAKVQVQKIRRELMEHGIRVPRLRLPKGKDPADLTEEERRELLEGGRTHQGN